MRSIRLAALMAALLVTGLMAKANAQEAGAEGRPSEFARILDEGSMREVHSVLRSRCEDGQLLTDLDEVFAAILAADDICEFEEMGFLRTCDASCRSGFSKAEAVARGKALLTVLACVVRDCSDEDARHELVRRVAGFIAGHIGDERCPLPHDGLVRALPNLIYFEFGMCWIAPEWGVDLVDGILRGCLLSADEAVRVQAIYSLNSILASNQVSYMLEGAEEVAARERLGRILKREYESGRYSPAGREILEKRIAWLDAGPPDPYEPYLPVPESEYRRIVALPDAEWARFYADPANPYEASVSSILLGRADSLSIEAQGILLEASWDPRRFTQVQRRLTRHIAPSSPAGESPLKDEYLDLCEHVIANIDTYLGVKDRTIDNAVLGAVSTVAHYEILRAQALDASPESGRALRILIAALGSNRPGLATAAAAQVQLRFDTVPEVGLLFLSVLRERLAVADAEVAGGGNESDWWPLRRELRKTITALEAYESKQGEEERADGESGED
ncbi:MAG: hypothetical protein GY851_21585 [bacterium]|nr:hypothetical protein [bacterium]